MCLTRTTGIRLLLRPCSSRVQIRPTGSSSSASGYNLWWRSRGSLRGCCRCSRSSAQDWSHLNLGSWMITQVCRGWSWLGVRINPCSVSQDLSGSLVKNSCMWFAYCPPFVWNNSRPTRHGPVDKLNPPVRLHVAQEFPQNIPHPSETV